ncbi:Aste57867_15481 [Aphanomyces stellatus]|uniref:Aste57867_15481 protein n=1 Tax=Aphanomyces stellatus TaxID=120398 RepID=A0A485L3H7_9STRA|nr:hypothetical protein As57867_015425 [Aphanomyces stellatus]VFT92283.1 Aste57867_15481 [Aphanomyces stellatus]
MERFLALSSELEGRDKLTKFCQYSSRGLAFVVLSTDPKSVLGQRLTALYKATQAARKAFRVGKSLNCFPKIDATLNNKTLASKDQSLMFVQDVGMCCFFLFDNIQFFANAKVLPFDSARAGENGGYFWFCANVAGFILAYEALQKEAEKEAELLKGGETNAQAQLQALRDVRFKKSLTLLKVTCDLIVSCNTAGVRIPERLFGRKLNDGVIGALGCVSAAVVLHNLWGKRK